MVDEADQGAGGIEEVDEEEGEDDGDQAEPQGATDVELQEGGRGIGWHGGDAMPALPPLADPGRVHYVFVKAANLA